MTLKPQLRSDETRRELLALLLAGLACVTVLVLSIVETQGTPGTNPGGTPAASGSSLLLLLVLITGAACATGTLAFVITGRARRSEREKALEATDLRRQLIMSEAVFKAEPQILIFWEHDSGLRVVNQSLSTVAGVPQDREGLLSFGTWLDARSVHELKVALDALFEDGRAFNLFLKTAEGGDLEADGRAAGSRAVLRFRDVAGYKHDLVHLIERHRRMAGDIETSRNLLNTLPMPVWLRDDRGRIGWVNDAYIAAVEAADEAEVTGRQIELLETRQRNDLAADLAKSEMVRKRMPIIVGGERKAHEVVAVPTDGSQAFVAIDVAELENKQGELDRQLHANDRTLDRVSTAVAIFNSQQQLTFFNIAYSRLWQLDPNWLERGPTHSEVLDRLRELSRLPQVADYRVWKQALVSSSAKKRDVEDLWYLPDGRMIEVLSERRPDGGVAFLYEDKSEKLALESRYKTMNQVQRETLDSLRDGVAVFSTDSRLRLFNSAFANIWRLSPAALAQGPRVDELVTGIGETFQTDSESWSQIVACITTISGEYRSNAGTMNRGDGSFIDYAVIPLPDGGTLVTFSDVTATRRYQRALVERNEALEATDKLKNNFISHVSYELRTPLTDIIGFSELLDSPRTGELNETQREYLGAVSASSRQLRSVIDNILDLASIDAGAIDLEMTTVDVRDVVTSAVDGIRERASRAKVTVDVGIADDLRTFRADQSRVRQILFNLVSNAIGFSKPGDTVFVSAWRDPVSVVFEIVDQGIGIPDGDRDRIFERFVSQSQGSKHRGAGLGLSIVKSVAELHGGSVELSSKPNDGTRVIVRLPHNAEVTPSVTPTVIGQAQSPTPAEVLPSSQKLG
ncbi:MAG: ATP-binding protein [Pseudomonadota bacterium]